MEAFPPDWHAVGQSGRGTASSAAGGTRPGVKPRSGGAPGSRGAHAAAATSGARSAVLIALLIGAAVLEGLVAVVATVVLAAPHGDLVIAAEDVRPAADRVTGLAVGASSPAPGAAGRVIDPAPPLVVDVEGAVRMPGVHRVPAGARLGDAIAAAGGYGPRVDAAAVAATLNLAEPLVDGSKVHVPVLGESPSVPSQTSSPPSSGTGGSALIDLNHADQAALESLPGVGPVTAGKIIAARESAPFATVDELVSRDVVGPSTLEKLRALVTLTP